MGKSLNKGRGGKIFLAVLLFGVLVSLMAFGVLVWWSRIVRDLCAERIDIPPFYRAELLTGIITSAVTGLSAVGTALIARYGAREATGNLRGVHLSEDAAKRMVEGEDK